jgi:hypothetical protein
MQVAMQRMTGGRQHAHGEDDGHHGAADDAVTLEEQLFRLALMNSMQDASSKPRAPPPASKDSLAQLTTGRAGSRKALLKEKCVVCSENFKPSDTFSQLPCNHVFHQVFIGVLGSGVIMLCAIVIGTSTML